MSEKELNLWIEKFSREIGYKSAVIVFGNTTDIIANPKNSGKYDSIVDVLTIYIRDKGYKQIVKWDRVDGIDYSVSDKIVDISPSSPKKQETKEFTAYDLGDDVDLEEPNQTSNSYR